MLPPYSIPDIYPSTSDMEELKFLIANCEPKIFGAFVSRLQLKIDKEAVIRIGMGEYERFNVILWRIARSLKYYRRLSLLHLLWRLLKTNRVMRKIVGGGKILSNKKKLEKGFTAAIVGADGAGKTTILGKVEEFFKDKIDVDRVYLGSNKPGVGSRLFRVITLPLKAICLRLGKFLKLFAHIADIIVLLQECFYLKERKSRFQKALRMARHGKLVFLERFPVPDVQDAGYELTSKEYKGYFDRIKREILGEYNNFGEVDVVIFLSVDPAIAVQRKPDHDINEVRRKAEQMEKKWQQIKAARYVRIDATLPLDEVIAETINGIWNTRL